MFAHLSDTDDDTDDLRIINVYNDDTGSVEMMREEGTGSVTLVPNSIETTPTLGPSLPLNAGVYIEASSASPSVALPSATSPLPTPTLPALTAPLMKLDDSPLSLMEVQSLSLSPYLLL